LALCKLADDDTERRRKINQKATEEVADKVRQDLKQLVSEPVIKFTNTRKKTTIRKIT